MEGQKLGRWLGPSHDIGQAMSSKILTDKGRVLSRTSVWLVPIEHMHDDTWKEKANSYTSLLTDALGA